MLEGHTGRSAGFPTCCIADFPIGVPSKNESLADLEARDSADLEVGAMPVGVHGREVIHFAKTDLRPFIEAKLKRPALWAGIFTHASVV